MSPSGRNRVRGSVLFWVAAALLAGAAGIGFALWRAPKTVSLPAPDSPGAAAPAPMPAPPSLAGAGAGAGADAGSAAPPQQPPAGLPPAGVSADQWRSLQAELAGRPEELRRLTAYFAFNANIQRFRASNPGNAQQRSALAAALDAGLDERLRQHELSAPEARLIKIAVLDVLVADAAQRQAALAQWEAALPAALPDAARLARDSEFQRRQAGIVAAWAATPPAQRDQRALERELDALRRSTFTQAR